MSWWGRQSTPVKVLLALAVLVVVVMYVLPAIQRARVAAATQGETH